MGIRAYLILMTITTIIAWTGWAMVITNIDPETAGLWGFTFFYLSFFLSLLGSFSIIGYVVRFIWSHLALTPGSKARRQKQANVYRVSTAFRQALLWSLAITIALTLQSQRLLVWWLMLLLVVVFALIEFTIISLTREKNS